MDTSYFEEIEALLPQVSRPSRYLGNEVNIIRKDLRRVRLRFALAFPDTYEVGMSHLGYRILYHILNRREDVAAERFFRPWPDMEDLMRQRGIPLCSQESRAPLSIFHVIGFSLPYEMVYTNVLGMLEHGGIPLESARRPDPFPLVIGGGPCAVNPEPLAPFFDAFVVGDGEEVVEELVDVAAQAREEGWDKDRLLEALAQLEGVYVPAFFKVEYGSRGEVLRLVSRLHGYERVRRRIARDLNPLLFPEETIVPYAKAIHDRVSLEIARGCTRGCRFCQAGYIYRPVRERTVSRLLDLAEGILSATGFEELSLLSLSAGDYSRLEDLVRALTARFSPERVALSFPSLRIGGLSDEIMGMIKEVRKTGITVAPEAGTDRLRAVINKDILEEEILETARRVFSQGWLSLKLYFMVGLPTETEQDLEGIVALCRRIRKEGGGRRMRRRLTVSLSTFVPKPHTPFQWVRQLEMEETQRRLKVLRAELRRLGIHVKWQDPRLSLLEGAFSRGDRRLAPVLKRAHAAGCRFDGWSEHLRFDIWERAFLECGLPLEEYAAREFSMEDLLPWDHIDIGISKEFLKEEYGRALAGERTPDCRGGECHGCGVCDFQSVAVILAEGSVQGSPFPGMRSFRRLVQRSRGREVHRRFRVRYAKRGQARFLSHLELNSVIMRALRRARLPLRFSQGFHSLPRIDFGPALPVGVESLTEFFDFECFGHLRPGEVEARLKEVLPTGIDLLQCVEVPIDAPSLFTQPMLVRYRIRIPASFGDLGCSAKERVERFLASPRWNVVRQKNGRVQYWDVRPLVRSARWISEDTLQLEVPFKGDRGVRLLELLRALLGLEGEAVRGLEILKEEVRSLEQGEMDAGAPGSR